MITFSYCVSPGDSGWHWELKAPDCSVMACGVSPSDVAARVAAIRAALISDEMREVVESEWPELAHNTNAHKY
jgi:hypothetical protein